MWPFGGDNNRQDTRQPEARASAAPHPLAAGASADQCPVDDETRSVWLAQQQRAQQKDEAESSSSSAFALLGSKEAPRGTMQTSTAPVGLSSERVVSSIPRFSMWQSEGREKNDQSIVKDGSNDQTSESSSSSDPSTSKNWVYPSPSQFYSAMARKNHNPRAEDMNTVVPIHNAVNERAWQQILAWEHMAGDGGASMVQCGGPKLVSFKGRPKDVTWRAWWRSLIGYQSPFDRHDWIVDRCGTRVTYVIDFYSGRAPAGSGIPAGLSFFLDVRPSPGQWEGIRMRFSRFLGLGYSQEEPAYGDKSRA